MYKLLIVDDEELERLSLKKNIYKLKSLINWVFEARNGEEAVELAEKVRPDIIIMDIKMPGKSGLEASKEIKESLPNVKILILSAFDFFDYAQEAVKFGAFDYLLKPIRSEQLLNTLKRTLKELIREKRKSNEEKKLKNQLIKYFPVIKNSFIHDLVSGNINTIDEIKKKSEFLGIKIMPSTVFVINVYYEEVHNDPQQSEIKWQYIRHQLLQLLERKILGKSVLISTIDNDKIVLLYGHPNFNEDTKEEDIHIGRKIIDLLTSNFNIYLTVGIGNLYPSILDISQSYIEAKKSLRYFKLTSKNQLIHISNITQEKEALFSIYQRKLILKAFYEDGKQEAIRIIKKFLDEAKKGNNLREIKLFFLELFLQDIDEGVYLENRKKIILQQTAELISIESFFELEKQILKIVDEIFLEFKQIKSLYNKELINMVLRHIEENFAKDLNLDDLAKLVHLSPFYLSRQFKNATGKNLKDYINRLRIEKSKQLLLETDYSVIIISDKVGFNNINYFSKVFKKYVGYTPTEWRLRGSLN
ncbi:MAG: two-component system, response regulator YesN [Clostridia bacterium]|nr:two-component system, response regulator YesN [Clostridia bacterium]